MTLRQFTTIIVSTLAIAASISTAEARNRSFQYSWTFTTANLVPGLWNLK